MQRRTIVPVTLALSGVLPALGLTGAALAQPINLLPSNGVPYDARSGIAPALPVPSVPSADQPSAFLTAARGAVLVGRTGEAQEALARAETRLLDRALTPAAASVPDSEQAVLAIGDARRALAVHDRQAAIAAIDKALAAAERPPLQVAAASAPATIVALAPPLPPPEPVITRALLPGHWTLEGARYVWIPPETAPRRVQSAELVAGAYVWRDGAFVWVPTHYAY